MKSLKTVLLISTSLLTLNAFAGGGGGGGGGDKPGTLAYQCAGQNSNVKVKVVQFDRGFGGALAGVTSDSRPDLTRLGTFELGYFDILPTESFYNFSTSVSTGVSSGLGAQLFLKQGTNVAVPFKALLAIYRKGVRNELLDLTCTGHFAN